MKPKTMMKFIYNPITGLIYFFEPIKKSRNSKRKSIYIPESRLNKKQSGKFATSLIDLANTNCSSN